MMIQEELRSFKYLKPNQIITPEYKKTGIDSDEEEGFAASIKENGIITPLIVTTVKDSNRYKVITGVRRLHYAKALQIEEIPCIIWKNANNPDIALAQLIEVAHKRNYTDEQKAKAIAAVYESIGVSPETAIQYVKHLHNEKDQENNPERRAKNEKVFRQGRRAEKPSTEFLKLCEKIGYSPSRQYTYLQLITQLEPEVLNFAVEKGLPMRSKTLLTHSQLDKALDNYRHADTEKPATPEQKIQFKKGLVRDLVGRRETEAKEIIHQAISDLRDGVPDMDSGIMYTHKRRDVDEENMVRSKEGEDMAHYSFWIGAEAMIKTIKALTAGHIHEEKGMIWYSDIEDKQIDNVVKTYTVEIVKHLDDQELRSMLDKLIMIAKLAERIVPLMEKEQDTRIEKGKMSGV